MYRKAVFTVVWKKQNNKVKYLLLKRKLHWIGWEFPKGGLERGENLVHGVKREVKEETSLKPINIKKFGNSGKYRYAREYADRAGVTGQTWKLFSVQVKSARVKLDILEHSAYKWLDYKGAYNKLRWKNQKKCLQIVNKSIK